MSTERDFKGIWIPKEIWLDTRLNALEKVIYAEISSLDTETHCVAGNEYLADFCGCSERKVSDTITKLVELGLVETVSFDGRHRVLRVAENSSIEKSARQSRKICEADEKNMQSIKINNNTNIISNTPLPPIEPIYFPDDRDELIKKWIAYRKSIKKSLKPESIIALVKKINDLDLTYEQLEQCINLSIENSYQGLFFDKVKTKSRYDWKNA